MESNDELKDFDFGNILKDEKSCENLVYNILFKNLVSSKTIVY